MSRLRWFGRSEKEDQTTLLDLHLRKLTLYIPCRHYCAISPESNLCQLDTLNGNGKRVFGYQLPSTPV